MAIFFKSLVYMLPDYRRCIPGTCTYGTYKLESILTKRTQYHNNNGTNNKQLLNRALCRYILH